MASLDGGNSTQNQRTSKNTTNRAAASGVSTAANAGGAGQGRPRENGTSDTVGAVSVLGRLAPWRLGCGQATLLSVACLMFFVILVHIIRTDMPVAERERHLDSPLGTVRAIDTVPSVVVVAAAAAAAGEETLQAQPAEAHSSGSLHIPGRAHDPHVVEHEEITLHEGRYKLGRQIGAAVMMPSNRGLEGTLNPHAIVTGLSLTCKAENEDEFVYPDTYDSAQMPDVRVIRKRDKEDHGLYLEVSPLTARAVSAWCHLTYLVYTPTTTGPDRPSLNTPR